MGAKAAYKIDLKRKSHNNFESSFLRKFFAPLFWKEIIKKANVYLIAQPGW